MKLLKAFLRRLFTAVFWVAASPAILFGAALLSLFVLVLWAFEADPNRELTKEEYYGRWP